MTSSGHLLVIGGCGFIGSNLADALLEEGRDVVVLDDLSRPGVERNLDWLQARHRRALRLILADLRDPEALADGVCGAAGIFHLAGQVAVTSSLADPIHDFGVNAAGTLAILEAVRRHQPETPLVFASTNKVYGKLTDLPMTASEGQYHPADPTIRAHGIDERRPLDFCTPYGCSKGVADQYVLDYARSFGLRTAVLRMSCIYGPRQFGTEDQGWVAHFLLSALRAEPITVYGDGKQVRDVLHVADAVRAYRAILARIDDLSGSVFNLGGGPSNAVSLRQVIAEITRVTGRAPRIAEEPWRTGDQLYFVADTRALQQATGWSPRVGWRDGLRDLAAWLQSDLADRAAASGNPRAEAAVA